MKDQTPEEIIDGWLAKTGGYAKDMMLRDYFAAKATEEDIDAHIEKGWNEDVVRVAADGTKYIARTAALFTREQAKYRYADAMLKARAA